MRLIHGVGLIALLLGGPLPAAAQSATPAAASPAAASGDFSGLVDIGGRSLYLECRGRGSPTVILEAGLLSRSDIWSRDQREPAGRRTMVLPGVAGFTRVCAYDRPGTILDPDRRSRSDPVPTPRGAADMVADPHALLGAAAAPTSRPPTPSAAWSPASAATYPDKVAGLVRVGGVDADYYAAMREALAPEQRVACAQPSAEQPAGPVFERLDPDASVTVMQEAAAASPSRRNGS